jgi:hypothetical protein
MQDLLVVRLTFISHVRNSPFRNLTAVETTEQTFSLWFSAPSFPFDEAKVGDLLTWKHRAQQKGTEKHE